MYCPTCKNFNDIDFDPMENIKQFIKFVEQEEKKWMKF
jgi:phage FluMu protein Com